LQTKGQEGLREPQERATLPVPTAAFSKPVAKPAGPETPVLVRRGAGEWALAPSDFPQLKLNRPRLWWPNGYGRPELYHLRVGFKTAAGESDERRLRFGVRELSYELTLLDGDGRLRRVEYDPAQAQGEHVVNVSHEGMVESAEGWVASFMRGEEDSPSVRGLADRRASPHLVVRVNGVRIACRGATGG
jgi:hypothetical protein